MQTSRNTFLILTALSAVLQIYSKLWFLTCRACSPYEVLIVNFMGLIRVHGWPVELKHLFCWHMLIVNPSECRGSYTATSNMKLVHWALMGGLLHLVQWGGLGGAVACPGPSLLCQMYSPPINGQFICRSIANSDFLYVMHVCHMRSWLWISWD